MLNSTFNNISVISWLSVLLVEENEVLREKHRRDKFYRIILYEANLAMSGIQTYNSSGDRH
jgi:hypothetical protein